MYLNKESLYGNSKCKFILIKDSENASGVKLLKTVLKLFNRENANLHFMYYESRTGDLEKNLDLINITKTDAVSDPCGWNIPDRATTNMRSVDNLKKEVSEFKGVVIIDSLSPLLFHNDANKFYKTLHKILKENSNLQMIALFHYDVHDIYENEILERLASTVLTVMAEEDKLTAAVRYSSGKVTNQLTEYKISNSYEFVMLREYTAPTKIEPVKKPDPTANLTFNLKLTDKEKEARSQVVLPYMQMQNNEIILTDDMYDEEDPDDDLDI